MKRKLAIDFGFRYVKGFPDGNLTRAFMTPTAVGDAKDHKMTVTLGHVFDSASGINGTFSTGYYAVKFGGHPTNRQDRNWFTDPSFLKVFYGAMAEAGIKNEDTVDLVLCIPINDSDKGDTIRSVLNGAHSFTLRGQESVNFEVSVSIITLQGISAFLHYILGMDGRPRIDVEDKNTYGIDVGGKTFHEIMFSGLGDIEEGTSTTYDLGFWQVIHGVNDWLREEKGCTKSLLEVAEAVEKQTIFLDSEIDLTPIVSDLSASLAAKHRNLISSHNLIDFHNLLVAGGTGERFFSEYTKVNPRFQLIPNPQFANVVGAYKFSML